jgi:hypothetical protein
VKSGGALSPQPANTSGSAQTATITRKIHRPRFRTRPRIRPKPSRTLYPLRCRSPSPS